MKTALVHDWLTGMRGGEKCLEVFCELYPDADLYTLIHFKGSCSDIIERMNITTSYIQKFPFLEKAYRYYLPFMPSAIESPSSKSWWPYLNQDHMDAPKGSTQTV